MRGMVAGVLALAAVAMLPAAAIAEVHTLNLTLTGAQEVPPNSSTAVGTALFVYDTDTNLYDLDLFVEGIALANLQNVGPNATPIHIHQAPAGANGGIIVDVGWAGSFVQDGAGIRLTIDDQLFGGVQGALTTSVDNNEAALLAGNTYLNVHTQAFGGGEIRAQIPEPASLSVLALGGLALLRRRR